MIVSLALWGLSACVHIYVSYRQVLLEIKYIAGNAKGTSDGADFDAVRVFAIVKFQCHLFVGAGMPL